jgi:hypothetical protein
VARWVTGGIGVFVEVADLALVDGDGEHLFLLELVGVVLIALDDHESLVLVQSYLRGHQEDLGEEVSLLQDLLVVGLFQLRALVHGKNVIIAAHPKTPTKPNPPYTVL